MLGQSVSGDGHFEIFIRTDLAHAPNAMLAQIAAILAHELVYAAVGIAAGHGKAFNVSLSGWAGRADARDDPRRRLPCRHRADPCGCQPPCPTPGDGDDPADDD